MWQRMNTYRWKQISLILLVLFVSACSSQQKRDEEYFLKKKENRASRLQTPPGPGSWRLPVLP